MLKDQLYKILWYMRGGLTADQVFQLSQRDRKIILKIIEENIERTKKSKMPLL